MKIRGMRWGYDGGGFACGPVEGNTVVEIIVTHERHNYFVCASRMSEYMKLSVSETPIFDLLIESNHFDVDWEDEYQKIQEAMIEEYDFEVNDIPEELEGSEYYEVFKLLNLAMEQAYQPEDPTYEGAQAFIEDYVGMEISEFKLPDFGTSWGPDETYEDDELYASGLQIKEPDSGDWAGEIRVQCEVDLYEDDSKVYAFASKLDAYYVYAIYDQDVIDLSLADLAGITPIEKYESLTEAMESDYYQVYKRLHRTLEEI